MGHRKVSSGNAGQTSAVRLTNRTGFAGFVKPAGTTPADENQKLGEIDNEASSSA
jgi:hypothetical protein